MMTKTGPKKRFGRPLAHSKNGVDQALERVEFSEKVNDRSKNEIDQLVACYFQPSR